MSAFVKKSPDPFISKGHSAINSLGCYALIYNPHRAHSFPFFLFLEINIIDELLFLIMLRMEEGIIVFAVVVFILWAMFKPKE